MRHVHLESVPEGVMHSVSGQHAIQVETGTIAFVMAQIGERIQSIADHRGQARIIGEGHQTSKMRSIDKTKRTIMRGLALFTIKINPTTQLSRSPGQPREETRGNRQ